MNPDIRILVAAHKEYWMPDDPMYLPVRVGAALSDEDFGYQRDDEGENISAENPHYSELTALFWGWKNLDADYIGLAQYRRHFKGAGQRHTLTSEEARELLKKAPVLLPKRRNYYLFSVEDHYGSTFDPEHIAVLRRSISALEPEYLEVFNEHMASTSTHILNMSVMRRDLLDAYCSWLFPLLEDVSAHIDYSGMTPFQARVIGRMSERLLDPWLQFNDVPFIEIPAVNLEGANLLRKSLGVLGAKFFGKKYEKSF